MDEHVSFEPILKFKGNCLGMFQMVDGVVIVATESAVFVIRSMTDIETGHTRYLPEQIMIGTADSAEAKP